MKIGRMDERILIQKNEVHVDAIGNHRNSWTDYYSCSAYPSTYSVDETEGEVQRQQAPITFSVRYCPETALLTPVKYRVVFRERLYNIEAVDLMNYNKQEVRIRCTLEVRQDG